MWKKRYGPSFVGWGPDYILGRAVNIIDVTRPGPNSSFNFSSAPGFQIMKINIQGFRLFVWCWIFISFGGADFDPLEQYCSWPEMHGRPRKPQKPEEEEASAVEAAKLRNLQSQLLANHHQKKYNIWIPHRYSVFQLRFRFFCDLNFGLNIVAMQRKL